MKYNRIFTIGETVYDIIFKNNKQVSAKPGGAMLNSAVSLGRLGLSISFISEIGEDQVGKLILDFLNINHVGTDSIYKFKNGKTAIAHALLDEQENASYTFYKDYPKERLNVDFPKINKNDIVLFGSFFAITHEVRSKLVEFIKSAKESGAIITYDPNFRKPHLKDLPEVRKYILENISLSDIVRGSDEDFKLIFNTTNADDTLQILKENDCSNLIYTSGNKNVEFRSDSLHFSKRVPNIQPVSTVGAGDSFNAGIIYSLYKYQVEKDKLENLSENFWTLTIETAISFGSHVCQGYDNYISESFASSLE